MDCLFVGLCDWGVADRMRQGQKRQFFEECKRFRCCGRKESSEGTIASEDLAKMQKQDMTFSYAIDADDESSGNADVPVNKGVTSQNGGSSGEDSYVVVTDDSGQAVKDDSGNVVTEVVKGETTPVPAMKALQLPVAIPVALTAIMVIATVVAAIRQT